MKWKYGVFVHTPSSIYQKTMKDDLLLINEENLSERIPNKRRSYISLRYWIGWAGGYSNTNKNKENK